MLLAKELLERGERQAVIDYLELCKKFCPYMLKEFEAWIATARKGGVPGRRHRGLRVRRLARGHFPPASGVVRVTANNAQRASVFSPEVTKSTTAARAGPARAWH